MSAAIRTFSGTWGDIHELPPLPAPKGAPEKDATLQYWFLHAPRAHPIWPQYLFFVVHLRDVDGQTKVPFRRYHDSTHEVMLLALNPERGPWTLETVIEKMQAGRGGIPHSGELRPAAAPRVTDAQACQLTALLARGPVDGHVPIEKDDWGGRARWEEVIEATLEHIVTGTHADPPRTSR